MILNTDGSNTPNKRYPTIKIQWILFMSAIFSLTPFHLLQAQWKVTPYADHIIKVTYTPSDYQQNENVSDAVILKPVSTSAINYHFDKNSIYIGKNREVSIDYVMDSMSYKGFVIHLHDKEKVYGGGERALPLNRRGYAFNLDNNPWYGYGNGADNLNFSVPFFTFSSGYGLFFDNPSKGKVDIGKTDKDKMYVTFSGGEINFYIIFGNSPKEILTGYHQLTGKQGLPPRWSLGNFMSRFGYASENQVFEIAKTMQKEKIPFDAIIIDLFWFGDSIKGTMGNLEWVNKKRWPDPKGMIKTLREQSIKTILITEPFVLKSSTNYASSVAYHATDKENIPYVLQDFYFGKGGLIDIFRKDAQKWFWEKHDAQNQIGVAAWWGDLGEPEKHPADLYHKLSDSGHSRLFQSHEVHNIYGHTWTKMLYENYATQYPDTRLFSLNRSGFAGSQRYNIIPWSGDVSRSWSGLQAQLPIMLGMSMSGIPYIHSDAGGFAGGEGDLELYIRWLQFSAYTPIFRPHGTALFELDPAAYSFPSEPCLMPSPYKEIAADIVRTRYRLLPYNYTLSYQQATNGEPLVAPMYYYYPNDSIARNVEDQFMWGPYLTVAPVIQADKTSRSVYLPGGKWYRFDPDKNAENSTFSGKINPPVPLNKSLVYVKSGSFIPLSAYDTGATSEDFKTDSMTVHYYYSASGSSYVMYDDDGLHKNSLRDKLYELITFESKPTSKHLDIKISGSKHMYPGKTVSRKIKLVLHGVPANIGITNRKKNKLSMWGKSLCTDVILGDRPLKIRIY